MTLKRNYKSSPNQIIKFKEWVEKNKFPLSASMNLTLAKIDYDLAKENVFLNLEKGNEPIRFIEGTNGLKLTHWQKLILFCMYGIFEKEDGEDYLFYREFLIILGRGNGKTPFISSNLSYSWFSKGEFEKQFYGLAYNKSMASLLFNYLTNIIKDDFFVDKGFELQGRGENSKIVNLEERNFKCEVKAYEVQNVQSWNAGLIILDEIHTMQSIEPYLSARKGLKQPTSQLVAITTAGNIDEGLYDYFITRADNLLKEKELTDDRLLPFIFQGDDPTKWYEEEELKKANPSWNEKFFRGSKRGILQEVQEALKGDSRLKENILRYNLNIKVAGSNKFYQYEDFEYNHNFKMDEIQNFKWYVGIDFGTWRDLSSASFYGEDEAGNCYVISKSFVSKKGFKEHKKKNYFPIDEWTKNGFLEIAGDDKTDNRQVFNWIVDTVKDLNIQVQYVGYDPSVAGDLEKWFNDINMFEFSHLTKVVTTPNIITNAMIKTREKLQDKKLFFNTEFLKWQFLNISYEEIKQGSATFYKPDNKNKFRVHDEAVATYYAITAKERWRKKILKDAQGRKGLKKL